MSNLVNSSEQPLPPGQRSNWRSARDTIQQMITRGDVPQNAPLPAERTLAQIIGVNRRTIRKAIDAMVQEGTLIPKHPRGHVVAASQKKNQSDFLQTTIGVWTGDRVPKQTHPEFGLHWIGLSVIGALHQAGMNTTVFSQSSDKIKNLLAFFEHGPAGLIIPNMPGISAEEQLQIAELARIHHVPVVLMGNEEGYEIYDRVIPDHFTGSAMLVDWLVERGCRKLLSIRHMSVQSQQWFIQRQLGIKQRMDEHGLTSIAFETLHMLPDTTSDLKIIHESRTRLYAGYLVSHLLGEDPVHAILAQDDSLAFYIRDACKLLNKIPGRDIIIVGYDNNWMNLPNMPSDQCPVQVTIDKNNQMIGQQMVEMLLNRIAGKLPDEPQSRMVCPTLVVSEKFES